MSNTITTGARQAMYGMRKRMDDYERKSSSAKDKKNMEASLLQRPEKVKDKEDTFIEDMILSIRKTNA